MARSKKEREVSIVHFSFFDLLFGAFGAFVFLMIMQVLSTLNMVDIDLQQLIDRTIHEKAVLSEKLEAYQQTEEQLASLQQKYDLLVEEQKASLDEQAGLRERNTELETELSSLRRELSTLAADRDADRQARTLIKELEKEVETLTRNLAAREKEKADLEAAQARLTGDRPPLRIVTKSFPTTINGEVVHLALAARGGVPPYTWEIDGKLPSGLTLDPTAGTISGRITGTGDFKFTAGLQDQGGAKAEKSQPITFKVIEKYSPPRSRASEWFIVATVALLLWLGYRRWKKYKMDKYIKEMENKGYQLKFIKEA